MRHPNNVVKLLGSINNDCIMIHEVSLYKLSFENRCARITSMALAADGRIPPSITLSGGCCLIDNLLSADW